LKKLSDGSFVGAIGCFHCRMASTTKRKQAALTAKTPSLTPAALPETEATQKAVV
jgi:hypothetical protein